MRIAVTSQNATSVTGHAGRCRRFLLFEVEGGQVASAPSVVELEETQTFHHGHQLPSALAGIDALITQGMGEGLFQRLTSLGITPVITTESSPALAVTGFVQGTLARGAPHAHGPGHGHH